MAGVDIGLKFPEVKAEATEAMVAMKALIDEIVKGGRVRVVAHAAKRAHEKLSSMMKKAHKKECSGMTMKLLWDIAKTLYRSPAMKEAIEKILDYVHQARKRLPATQGITELFDDGSHSPHTSYFSLLNAFKRINFRSHSQAVFL